MDVRGVHLITVISLSSTIVNGVSKLNNCGKKQPDCKNALMVLKLCPNMCIITVRRSIVLIYVQSEVC